MRIPCLHILIAALLLAVAVPDAVAQRLREGVDRHSERIRRDIPTIKYKRNSGADDDAMIIVGRCIGAPDTVYSIQTTKCNGWFGPLGVITPEEASHRNVSVRFTRRSPKGKWQRLETVDGYGNYVVGVFQPYLVKINNESDSVASREWVERLQKTCIYEIIPDASGDNVVQERAYDADMNLVYIYTRTPVGTDANGRRRFVGSYRDYLGRPAEMRPDTTGRYTYGSLVMLTEDRWGNDSIIEYMDARGVKKPNGDGVAMEVHIYDRNGDHIRTESRDADGYPVTDNWSNSGLNIRYNNHVKVQGTYTDPEGRPTILNSPFSTENNGVASINMESDRYAREIRRTYADTEGRPTTTSDGVAEIRVEYDNHGAQTAIRYFGPDGRPCNGYADWAVQLAEYDQRGHLTSIEWLDSLGRPNQNTNYLSRRFNRFNDDGKIVLTEQYEADGDRHRLIYREEHTPRSIAYTFRDGSSRIDSLDQRGRTIYTGYFDADGHPGGVDGWTTARHIYRDAPGRTYNTDRYFDQAGHPVNCSSGYASALFVTDSATHTMYTAFYDKAGRLYDSHIKALSTDFSDIVGQYDINRFGIPTRAGAGSQVRYYYADVISTQNSDAPYSALIGRDEFGEPDYISSNWALYYYMRNGVYHDEDNHPVTDIQALANRLPKVMTVEVTDSTAYRLGLRDNDIIISDGIYGVPLTDSISSLGLRAVWTVASVLQPDGPRRMTVLRADTAARVYRPVIIEGITGRPSQNGYLTHVRYLTRRQTDRALRALTNRPEARISAVPLLTTGSHTAIVGMPDMYGSERNLPYPAEVTDPAVILSVCVPSLGMSWRHGEPFYSFTDILKSRQDGAESAPQLQLRYTCDGKTVGTLVTCEPRLGVRIIDTNLSDIAASVIAPLADAAATATDASMKAARISAQHLRGTFAFPTDPSAAHPDELAITLHRDGTYTLRGYVHAIMADNSGASILLRIDLDTAQPRPIAGNTITITTDAAYHCIDIANPPAGELDELKSMVDRALASPEFREQFIPQIKWCSPVLTRTLQLSRADDGQLHAITSDGKDIKLTKLK